MKPVVYIVLVVFCVWGGEGGGGREWRPGQEGWSGEGNCGWILKGLERNVRILDIFPRDIA